MATEAMNSETQAWRFPATRPSLPEIHSSLQVPAGATFLRKLLSFAGPGFLVAVGYMDPGNWATDLAGGSKYNYSLLSVIMISNLMAVLLQRLAIKLGVATGRDLAQACREHFSRAGASMALWIFAEVAIAACDLAEVIGSAIALNLLFHIPLIVGVCLTALDVLLILFLQQRGFRFIEALVITLNRDYQRLLWLGDSFFSAQCLGHFAWFCSLATDSFRSGMLYIAIGILGATVMPHNLYLHSAIVQSRNFERNSAGKREAIKFCTIDSAIALTMALFVNAAILIVSAATFYRSGMTGVAEINDAYKSVDSFTGGRRGEHRVCTRASRLRTEFDLDRNPGRPGGDGRLSQYSLASMAAPADYSRNRHHSGSHCDRILGRKGYRKLIGIQPGHSQHAAEFCGDPAGDVYQRQRQDGRVRELAGYRDAFLGRGRVDRRA